MDSATKAMFVTGGASGIGLATARLFADRGWRVGLADINADALDRARDAFPEGRVSTHVMDVRDREQWESALAEFLNESGGRLDLLFANAGIPEGGVFADTPGHAIDRVVGVNLMGVVHAAQYGWPYLSKTPGSCLLVTSSAAGIHGTPGVAIYSATKFAVRGLAESLDAEWAHAGVKVRLLMPSFIDTPLLDHSVSTSNRSVRESVTAGGLEITPVDTVAQAAWDAVHGDRLHTVVGKTARRLKFAARWMPNQLRRSLRARPPR